MKLSRKKIIIFIILILAILISLFFVFRKEKVFILYIETLDREILNQYSVEQLPNLKELYQSDLNSEISLNLESSFLTILSGEYRYESANNKSLTEYFITKKEIDNLGLFYQTDLYQYAQENELTSKFFDEKINFENINYNIIVHKYRVEDDSLESYEKVDNLIEEIKKKISFNTKLLIISSYDRKTISNININQVLVDKGFLACPKDFQDLSECDLASSFAYSPASGEVYINKKDREKLGRVAWDFQGVLDDTVYVLSFNEDIDFRMYKSQEYFKQKNIPEILVFENDKQEKGLILSNKKFVQNEYNFLEVLKLIFPKLIPTPGV